MKHEYTMNAYYLPLQDETRWHIRNPQGTVIAEAAGERSARRIVKALNAYKERLPKTNVKA